VGDFDEALSRAEEALEVSQTIGNPWGQAYSLYLIGEINLERGQINGAIDAFREGLLMAEQANFLALQIGNRTRLAVIYSLLGDIGHGVELAEQALTEASELDQLRIPALVTLAYLHLSQGDLAAANDTIKESQSILETDEIFTRLTSFSTLFEGEIALANKDYEQALDLTEKTIEAMQTLDIRVYRYDMLHLNGKALQGLGQDGEARDVLSRALAEAEHLSSRRGLLQILPTMIETEFQVNERAEPEQLRQKARENIEFIRDQIDDPDLRASFLRLPHVKAVMDPGSS
jgi:tetratricopeptide (TPR) repeat protein